MATNDTQVRTLKIMRALADRVVDLEQRLAGAKPPRAIASMRGATGYERACRLVDAGRQNEIIAPQPPGRGRRR